MKTCSILLIAVAALWLFMLIIPPNAIARPPAQDAGSESAALHALFNDHNTWEMNEFPEQAMHRGDYSNADRITDNSLAAIERRFTETEAFLERLLSIDREKLNASDQTNYDTFGLMLKWDLDDHPFRTFLMPAGQRWGVHQSVAEMAERVRFRSVDDYRNYLLRLEQVPTAIDNSIELMKIGVQEGRTPPAITLREVPGQITKLLAEGGLDALAKPFEEMPERFPDDEARGLRLRFDSISLPAVRNALTKYQTYFNDSYLPNCRESIAAIDLPNGEAYYEHQLLKMTTTDTEARIIHKLGLREVERIRAEMIRVIRRSDFLESRQELSESRNDQILKAFIQYLRTDPRFYHTSADELIAGYRAICKEVDGHLPKYFGRLPRLPYGVKEIPEFMAPQQTTAYYSGGNIDNGEAGFFFANTYALDQRPKYEMIPLALHEAVPGHHLQIALAQEMDNMPEFRKHLYITAFGEGWALYTERLGIEMGLYDDPYDDFGRLTYEMWRACRLVVDTGMHMFGWSRERAIEFMLENTALSRHNIEAEVDRYIAWPGQACAYKIGEMKIRELRREAEQKLGGAFDLRAFHDVVLEQGAVPLVILERRVHQWINSFPIGQAYD